MGHNGRMSAPKPIYLTFNGKRWKLVSKERMRDFGQCDDPNKRGKEIRIRAGQAEFELLGTYLHEFTHASFWNLAEEAVAQFEKDVATALWRLGYRRVASTSAKSEPPAEPHPQSY